ncbi:MAG: hypothetical protein HGA31_02165 [Candidatus Moranbacteria bacterium]|nr:hypothetical protein [Candidatus Moranbacteria bacterium]
MKDGVALMISREGDNLFIDGLPFSHGTKHIVSASGKDDLAVENGKRAYVSVDLMQCGFKAEIRRKSDDAVLARLETTDRNGTLRYDPWDHVSPIG